jgi:hypothetical protein
MGIMERRNETLRDEQDFDGDVHVRVDPRPHRRSIL